MSAELKVKPSLLEILTGFMTIGLTSIGGAAGPFRHVAVVQRRWLTEREFAELYGLGQALPGSVVMNVATMLTDRLAGPLGPLAALAGLIIPAMVLAIVLSGIATNLAAANARFAAGEVGVTAAIAGVFASNGVRVLAQLWSDTPDVKLTWRCTRIAIGALGVVLVVGLHIIVPLAMIVLVALSLLVEWRLRDVVNAT
jgi:chromate transporter